MKNHVEEPKHPLTPFTPAPVGYESPRSDGWTADRQEAFLKALAACGCVTDAARAVGMSRQSAHNLYNRPAAAAFRAGWDAALDCSMPVVESNAWERTVKGVPRPIFYKGEQVGEYRHYDERLTMFLLRYRRPHRYGAHLDRLPVPLSQPPPGCEDRGRDPEEPVWTLDFHFDDLVDEAKLPGGVIEESRANDGVNFVNFVGFRAEEHPGDASSTEGDAPPPSAEGLGSEGGDATGAE